MLPTIFPIVTKKKTSILEEVQVLVRESWGDEKLREYLEALNNKDAVTGSLIGDKIFAADVIQKKAQKSGFALTASAKHAEIARCVEIVLRRVDLSHTQRLRRLEAPTYTGEYHAPAAE